MNGNEAIVITGEQRTALVRLLAVRAGLGLEVKGLRRSGGRSMRAVANAEMGTALKTARAAYEAFDIWLVQNYGAEPRPLKENR